MITKAEPSPIFKTRGPLDPVIDRTICVARPELDQLLRVAQAPTVDAYLAIQSSRQTGKTTLLYQLRAKLRLRGYGIALIDLSVTRDQAEAELYRFVAGQMLSELELHLARPAPPGNLQPRRTVWDQGSLPCSAIQFRAFLLEIARQVQTPRLVIMFDEVEGVSEKCSDGLFGTIRNVFSSRRKEDEAAFGKYLIVLCGAKEAHRLTGGPNSPLNIAERVYLQDFDLEGVRYLTLNFRRAFIVAPQETAQWIYDQTSGHPYLTQKLCALIEQWRPGVITQEIVQRASVQLLRSDDHLEKMLIQVDSDASSRSTLEKIVSGKTIQFTRLQSDLARLEMIGAIRDAGNCAVRNPIYYAALRSHFNLKSTAEVNGRRWPRIVVAIVTFLVFLLNLPFLYNYTYDIYWSPRSVNDRFVTTSIGPSFLIHYDRVLRAYSPDQTEIAVDLEGYPVTGPIYITFQGDPELTLVGSARTVLDQPFQQARFKFSLNQSGLRVLRYNPFNPSTDHRQVSLVFESASGASQRETYTADFLVDYYSAFAFSAVVSLASFFASLGAVFANVGHVRRFVSMLARFAPHAGD